MYSKYIKIYSGNEIGDLAMSKFAEGMKLLNNL
jgi:hypothetical protein